MTARGGPLKGGGVIVILLKLGGNAMRWRLHKNIHDIILRPVSVYVHELGYCI